MDRHLAKTLTIVAVFLLASGSQVTHAEVGQFSICGDVPSPQTYQTPTADRVSARNLVQMAGGAATDGTVSVFRGQDRVPAFVARLSAMTREATLLETGDIVVFHADTPHDSSNALVLLTDIPSVLPLPDDGVTIAALKANCDVPTDCGVRVTRVTQGQVTSQIVNDDSLILHGDLIHLSEAIASHVVPESLQHNNNPHSADTIVKPVSDTADSITGSLGLTIPGVQPESHLALPEPNVASPVTPELQTRQPQSHIEEHVVDDNSLHTASLQHEAPAGFTDTPVGSARAEAETSNAGIWNVIFVGGLLCALGLIGVGWIRTRQEREMEIHLGETLKQNIATEPVTVQPRSSQMGGGSTRGEESGVATIDVDDDCPVLSAGLHVASDITAIDSPVATFVAGGNATLTNDWFTVPDEISAEATSPTAEPTAAAVPDTEAVAEAHATAESTSSSSNVQTETWTDLEDLIQNRLPVDLTELQLPLQVSMFGQPAGPRRLRIDAAHKEIAPPQFAQRARRNQKPEPVTATAAAAGAKDKFRSGNTEAGDGSRLDQALNFLEEQSET